MGALNDLEAAAERLETARLELDTALTSVCFRHEERHALGALSADVVACARHLLPRATIDELAAANREIAILEPRTRKNIERYEQHDGDITAMLEEVGGDDPAEIRREFELLQAAHAAGAGPRARDSSSLSRARTS